MIKIKLQALFAASAAAALLLAPVGNTVAEELRMSVKEKAERSAQANLPSNGLSETSVENRWGPPQSVSGPVGEPPIYQWHYQNFIVFFEDNRVIHTVLRQDR